MYFLMNIGLKCRNIFHIAHSLEGTEKLSIMSTDLLLLLFLLVYFPRAPVPSL